MDKRTYSLSPVALEDITPDYEMIIDKSGLTEAKKISLSNYLLYLAQVGGGLKPKLWGGTTNPDDADGANFDLYVKANTSEIAFYQKESGAWVLKASALINTDPKTETITPDTDPVVLTWSDTIPGDTRTYAQKHGNTIQVQAETPAGGLLMPDVVIARTGDDITTVTISYLETGSRIIIL